MHAAERSVQNDTHHLAPFGEAHLVDWLFTTERRIVDQEINSAKVLKGSIGERDRSRLIADIPQNGNRLAAGRFNLSNNAVSLRLVRADIDDDSGARLRECQRDRPADIAPSACDDGYLAGQFLVIGHDPKLSP